MSAPTPTYGDGLAHEIDDSSLSWMKEDLPTIVEMADLQSHESVLVVACGTGQLILEIMRASNGNHGRMVGVEDSRLAVQPAIQKLDTLGLPSALCTERPRTICSTSIFLLLLRASDGDTRHGRLIHEIAAWVWESS